MSRVVVTGGAGKLGRAVVVDLAEHGWEVVMFDRRPPAGLGSDIEPAITFVQIDLTDYASVLDAMFGLEERYAAIDAVVHLAAVPAPGILPDHATFQNNMMSTYNVFAAMRRAGVKNVVWASSETVLGLPFDTPPAYVPVDEEHAPRPESTYSLVKALEEEMAGQLCRWDPELKMIGLRFSNVMEPEDYRRFSANDEDIRTRKWNLWSYIDARDASQAVRLALSHNTVGCDVFIIANADTVSARPNDELLAEVFPEVEVRGPLGAHTTLFSIEKARRVLGYEPRHSWRSGAQNP